VRVRKGGARRCHSILDKGCGYLWIQKTRSILIC
jgi:hypothetical protein